MYYVKKKWCLKKLKYTVFVVIFSRNTITETINIYFIIVYKISIIVL